CMAASPAYLALHHECVEVVPVRIAEVAGVKCFAARAGGALVRATLGKRQVIEALHLRLVPRLECGHHAISDRRNIAVKRFRQADSRASARLAPGDERVELHHPADAELASNYIIEFGGA